MIHAHPDPSTSPRRTPRHQGTIHPSYHFYTFVAATLAGVVITLLLEIPIFTSVLWLLPALAFLVVAIFRPSRPALILATLAGLILGNFRASAPLLSRAALAPYIGETLTISGRIATDPVLKEGTTTFTLGNLRLLTNFSTNRGSPVENSQKSVENSDKSVENSSASPTPYIQLSGTLYVKISAQTPLERSDEITLSGKLSGPFGSYLGSLSRPDILALSRSATGDIFARFKNFFAGQIREHLPSPEADLGLGYLLGDRSALPDDLSEALRAVGMTHIVVASGAHLGIISDLIRRLFGRISRFAALFFSTLGILGFALTCGLSPSMTRAALVALLGLFTSYVGRSFTPLRLLSFVAALTLVVDPCNFRNLGWQLSFASFFGIMVIAPLATRFFYGGKKSPWLAAMLITSLSTTLVCAPILIYNFGTISLLGLAANLIMLPTLPYAMLLVFLSGATSFLPWLAQLIARAATLLLDFHIWLVAFLSDKTMFIISLPTDEPWVFLLYLPVVVFLVLSKYGIIKSWLSKRNKKCLPSVGTSRGP